MKPPEGSVIAYRAGRVTIWETLGRQQPYAVWYRTPSRDDIIDYFTSTLKEAVTWVEYHHPVEAGVMKP